MERFLIENHYTSKQHDLPHTMPALPRNGLPSGRLQHFTNRLALRLAEFLIACGVKLQAHYRQQMPVSIQRTNS